ncbi:hypothetical protein ACVILK_006080 [Bradyrhizobium embrapense]
MSWRITVDLLFVVTGFKGRSMFRQFWFGAAILCALASRAWSAAGSSVPFADGGYIPDYLKIVRQYNASGDEFRIEGICKSACTVFLGIRNVCVQRDAQLMFHAGHDLAENRTGPDSRASQALLSRYNEALRRYLLEGHHMDTETFHTMEGRVLIERFGYRECSPVPAP